MKITYQAKIPDRTGREVVEQIARVLDRTPSYDKHEPSASARELREGGRLYSSDETGCGVSIIVDKSGSAFVEIHPVIGGEESAIRQKSELLKIIGGGLTLN